MTPEQPSLEQILETLRETILPQSLGMGIIIVIWSLGLALYFLPIIIMSVRKKKHNTSAIAATNIVFGWTCIGYAVSFIWAWTDDPLEFKQQSKPQQKALPQSKSGEINTMKISPKDD